MEIVMLVVFIILVYVVLKTVADYRYNKLESEVLENLGFSNWNIIANIDAYVAVKSRQTLEKYDDIKFFKENKEKFAAAEKVIQLKHKKAEILKKFLGENDFKKHSMYKRIVEKINENLKYADDYRILVEYISSAGNHLAKKIICVNQRDLDKYKEDPSILMGKGEYNKYLKEQQKEALAQKQHEFYDRVNNVIDYANENRELLVIRGDQGKLDNLIAQLFDRTVNSIKKIKAIDSEEWGVISNFILRVEEDIKKIVNGNQIILDYYDSSEFQKIKDTCDALMSTQREFNEYINEKVQSISKLFGTRVVRNETVVDDEHNYIRPYKKSITPFTAEVSATVFASAENNPLEYIVKYFYPNKEMYPQQIQKLQLLIEELETLKEAKQIIENYKQKYQQYIGDVPSYVMENDEAGFYTRLGFAYIDESVLTVEYKFTYTSGGGFAQRSFTIPMTEETIVELVNMLENKLTAKAFAKEQRTLMTKKLRDYIKNRDNFTCCNCGNSTFKEPNLLLEIDHIIPVAKGGLTEESNLQTLCWKCNRSKSDKIM